MNVYGSTLASGGGGTSNYNDLSNKPSINGITLSGNKTTSDLGISSAVSYSTSEKAIGTWVNNATLYQRTFTGTTSSSSNETNVAALSGSYVVRSFEGAFKQESSGCEVPIIYSQVTDSNDWMNCYHYGGYITLSYGSNNRSKEYWVTIRYTK